MRKIVNGLVYDTDRALCLGRWTNGFNEDADEYCCETLYKTAKGAYFLACMGGAFSDYNVVDGLDVLPGEGIAALTEDEAKQWAEKHLETLAYEIAFGPVPEA